MIELGRDRLTLDDVARVARGGAKVTLAGEAREGLRASRAIVEEAVRAGHVVYGVTTGFGPLKDEAIPRDQIRALQVNLLRSHSAGVGDEAPPEVVRAMLLLRAASLALGHSGVRPEVVDALLALLSRDLLPVVPLQGSVGASGDLAPLAHLASVLIGEGQARLNGERLHGDVALKRAGLTPLVLEAKEGLALINGTQFSTACAALACVEALSTWEAAVAAAALSIQVLLGSIRPERADVHDLRPYPGAKQAARRLRTYAAESALIASHQHCARLQDAYSLRCAATVLGASWDALEHVARQLEIEANSVNDNPLVFVEPPDFVSAGLFHAQPVALCADYLKIAMAEVASISERRIDRLLDPRVSELPADLAHRPGLESGYMLAQYTAASLVSENKVLAHPASVDSIPTGTGVEDHVSMAPIAARHARAVVTNAAHVVALELLCACRALELRRPLTAGPASERIYEQVRRLAPARDGDAALSLPCSQVAHWILSGEPMRLAQEVMGS
jgi:histidine ammonia-lyase